MVVLALIGMLSGTLPLKAEAIGNPENWVMTSNIPPTEWARATVTSYDLTLDIAGKPVACTITSPSGSSIIDTVICTSLMRRAHYKPATDATGVAIPSVVRDHVQWHPKTSVTSNYLRNLPDVIVTNSNASSKTRFDLVQIVEIFAPSGAIESCEVYKSSKNQIANSKACRNGITFRHFQTHS